jgi:hypothetical protein
MRDAAQRLAWILRCATGVLLVGVLLAQYAPLGPLAQSGLGEPHDGCTEQACHCGDDCACDHCTHHHGAAEAGAAAHDSDAPGGEAEQHARHGSGRIEAPSFRSCGPGAPGLAGMFVLAKTLFPPAPAPAASLRGAHDTPSSRLSKLTPQRRPDDIFHPPKKHIG